MLLSPNENFACKLRFCNYIEKKISFSALFAIEVFYDITQLTLPYKKQNEKNKIKCLHSISTSIGKKIQQIKFPKNFTVIIFQKYALYEETYLEVTKTKTKNIYTEHLYSHWVCK